MSSSAEGIGEKPFGDEDKLTREVMEILEKFQFKSSHSRAGVAFFLVFVPLSQGLRRGGQPHLCEGADFGPHDDQQHLGAGRGPLRVGDHQC